MSERSPAPPSVEAEQFKLGMRSVAGAVTLVTSVQGGHRHGMAATAVCSVSAEPPTLLACVNRTAATYRAIARSGAFCVNVLRAEDHALPRLFSGTPSGESRFRASDWTRLATGAPALIGALVAFDCTVVKQVAHASHVIFLGEVRQMLFGKKGKPLLYADGQYARLTALGHEPFAEAIDWWGA